MSGEVEIRRELRPGDFGELIAFQARLYAREFRMDRSFETTIAAAVTEAADRGWPGEREGVWIVERDGAIVGSLALTDDGDTGWIRWFLLDPSLRGRGLGRQLLAELMAMAESTGHERLRLETFNELRTAAHMYHSHGFEVVSEGPEHRWGRQLTIQHYELELAPEASGELVELRFSAG